MINNLQTKRLSLTKPSLKDLEELYELTSKEEVNLFNPDGPDKDISEAKATLQTWIDDWEKENIGYFMVRIKDTGEYVGYVGLAYRDFLGMKVLNLAYRINPTFQKKGYTYEACTAIIREANKDLGRVVIRALTKKDNLPSMGLAKKLSLIHNDKFDNYPDEGDVHLFNVKKQISDTWDK